MFDSVCDNCYNRRLCPLHLPAPAGIQLDTKETGVARFSFIFNRVTQAHGRFPGRGRCPLCACGLVIYLAANPNPAAGIAGCLYYMEDQEG